jgi:hypothetical protein
MERKFTSQLACRIAPALLNYNANLVALISESIAVNPANLKELSRPGLPSKCTMNTPDLPARHPAVKPVAAQPPVDHLEF